MIQPGLQVGPYVLKESLGFGGSAIVHLATHSTTGRTVAIKFLPPIHDPIARARFRREGEAMRRLDHPSIVQVLDFGEVEGSPYLVFDYIPGGDLAQKLANGALPDGQAISILDAVARAIDFAHSQGVVHRDIKPANILLDDVGRPVVADFGLARLLDQDTSLTAAGIMSGTPAFMSPEQAQGGEVAGPLSDQFSLAAVAYQVLTGRQPFEGDTATEIVVAVLTRDPIPPSQLRPDLGPEIDAAILRGLAKDPAQRFPSCRALTDAILSGLTARLARLRATAAPTETPAVGPRPRVARVIHEQPHEALLTMVVNYEDILPRRRWTLRSFFGRKLARVG